MRIFSKDCVLLVRIYEKCGNFSLCYGRKLLTFCIIMSLSGKGFSPVMKKRLEKLGIDPTKSPEELTSGKHLMDT